MSQIVLKAFCNADDVHLVWTHKDDIPGCLGFAVQCRRGDKPAKDISNRVGFEDDKDTDKNGERYVSRPSSIWPFQRYDWTDHAADLGDKIAYRVVARVVDDNGKLRDGPASEWTKSLELSSDCGDGVHVHFNRGYVLSQFMARYMKRNKITLADLKKKAVVISKDVDLDARAFLGGTLREAMLEMMDEVAKDSKLELHAVLYELSDEELIDGLIAIGKRAHVVLANGSVEEEGEDENAAARKRLKKNKVVVHDRFLGPKALAHNKFVVIGRSGTTFKPAKVWTGSTNWTPTGLCTQLNNGIMIADKDIAAKFERQFELLADAKSEVPKSLVQSNNEPSKNLPLGGGTIDCWFTRVSKGIDLDELVKLVKGARQGILFVMFQPGNEPVSTLLQTQVLEMQKDKGLFVRGVATQYTGAGSEKFKLLKQDPKTFFLDSVQDSGVGKNIGRWAVEGTAKDFKSHIGHAITHSKVIVIDPFGNDSIVVTGSHNFSKSASGANDENFVVIRGHKQIAMHYAINAMQTYNHYRWRAYLEEARIEKKDPFQFLSRDPKWQKRRNVGETKRMLAFWLP